MKTIRDFLVLSAGLLLPLISLHSVASAPSPLTFVSQGVPEGALKRAFAFYTKKINKTLKVTSSKIEKSTQYNYDFVKFKNTNYMVIVDYSLPSTEKRLFLLDLKNGSVEKHYVSHGANTGGKSAYRFSNLPGSNQSSLGAFITGKVYDSGSFQGKGLQLYGAEASNDKAFARSIVMHPADYATKGFMQEQEPPRLGLSFGCFALDPKVSFSVIEKIKEGALIYTYYNEELAEQAKDFPEFQYTSHEYLKQNPETDRPVLQDQEKYQLSAKLTEKKKLEEELKKRQMNSTTQK